MEKTEVITTVGWQCGSSFFAENRVDAFCVNLEPLEPDRGNSRAREQPPIVIVIGSKERFGRTNCILKK